MNIKKNNRESLNIPEKTSTPQTNGPKENIHVADRQLEGALGKIFNASATRFQG